MSDPEKKAEKKAGEKAPDKAGSTADVTPAATSDTTAGEALDARATERSSRRIEKASEKAARAQRRADEARRRALEAVREGGLFEVSEESGGGRDEAGTPGTEPTGGTAAGEDGTADRADASATADERPRRRRLGELPGSRRLGSRAGLVSMVVLLAVLCGVATFAGVAWQGARDEAATEQSITAAPDDASAAAREILTDMFTYDQQTVTQAMDKVEPRLTGAAEEEFRTKSRAMAESATRNQKASVYSTVAAIAPEKIDDADHVGLLVMLNRMVSTEKNPKAQSAQSRIQVQMERIDGEWKLAKLESV